MRESPNCYVIHDVEKQKFQVVPATKKKELIKIILKGLEGFQTDMRINSAFMNAQEDKTQDPDDTES